MVAISSSGSGEGPGRVTGRGYSTDAATSQHALGRVEPPAPRAKLAPLAPRRFGLQVTIGQDTYEKLRYAQALLGHQPPAAELAATLDLAIDLLVGHLEHRKFAATSRPHPGTRRATGRRTIPARVKRAVWERDGGQCTFMSDTGRRCPARTRLEFDHADPVARGGTATVERMRLRCRAHNQYAAECTFGANIPEASLEERVRLALSVLQPPHRRVESSHVRAT